MTLGSPKQPPSSTDFVASSTARGRSAHTCQSETKVALLPVQIQPRASQIIPVRTTSLCSWRNPHIGEQKQKRNAVTIEQTVLSSQWNTGRMTIRADVLTELLKGFPADATVKGYNDGITIANSDGTGAVVLMNGTTHTPDMSSPFIVQGLPPSFLTKEV